MNNTNESILRPPHIERIRTWFESREKSFYGGNNLDRDSEGYDSSYVDAKWESTLEVFEEMYAKNLKPMGASGFTDKVYNEILKALLF